MGKVKPTRTTNRLPFGELDHRRFEDLCHALIYPMRDWIAMTHPGRAGTDKGRDIVAIEQTEAGERRVWVIQCKRYASMTPKQAVAAVDDATADDSQPIDVFVLVVASSISHTAAAAFKTRAAEAGIEEALIWDATYIESMLYSDR
jgi:HJR/Mrr/RecB family endonuclease